MEDYYKSLPPGLHRRIAYSKMLKNRRLIQAEIYMTYEELASLTPGYVGVGDLDYILNTSLSVGLPGDFCAICQDDLKPLSLARTLKCSHKFHSKCLYSYCKLYKKCPLCRVDIT